MVHGLESENLISGNSWGLHDGDILRQKLGLDVPHIDLLELTVTDVFLLVGNAGAGTSDVDRRKRGGENKTGSVRPDDINKVCGPCDIPANSTVSLSKGTCVWALICERGEFGNA